MLFAATTQAQDANWLTDFGKAYKLSQETGKPIFAFFTA
jgi:hypothetical protein